MNLKISRGTISFSTDKRMTLEDISNLAAAGKLVGIPASATISNVYFQFGTGPDGRGSNIDVAWTTDGF